MLGVSDMCQRGLKPVLWVLLGQALMSHCSEDTAQALSP